MEAIPMFQVENIGNSMLFEYKTRVQIPILEPLWGPMLDI